MATKEVPSEAEIEKAAEILHQLPEGILPFPIYKEICRLTREPTVELIPLRKSENGSIKVLLFRRPLDDEFWPGQLHTPGTGNRVTDSDGSFEDAFRRLIYKELDGAKIGEVRQMYDIPCRTLRGPVVAHIFYTEVIGEIPDGWEEYSVDNLPSDVVELQKKWIKDAAEKFSLENQHTKASTSSQSLTHRNS